MATLNLSLYNSDGSPKSLSQQVNSVQSSVQTIQSTVNQINSTASSLMNTTAQAVQTNVLPNLGTVLNSLNLLQGFTSTFKGFISEWNSKGPVLASILTNLSSFVTTTWTNNINNIYTNINTAGTLVGKIANDNTLISQILSGSAITTTLPNIISAMNGNTALQAKLQNVKQPDITTMSNEITQIGIDLNSWNWQYNLFGVVIGQPGQISNSQLAKAISQNLTPNMPTTSNSYMTASIVQQFIQNTLTTYQLNTITSWIKNPTSAFSTPSNLFSLSDQFETWYNYLYLNYSNLFAKITNDVQNLQQLTGSVVASNAGSSVSQQTVLNDMSDLNTYLLALVNLTNYWAQEITVALNLLKGMKTAFVTAPNGSRSLGMVNQIAALIVELQALIQYFNVYFNTGYATVTSENQKAAQQAIYGLEANLSNLQSYEQQLVALSGTSTSSKTNWLLIGSGIAAAVLGVFILLFKHHK